MADPIIASVLHFEADLAKTIQKTILRDLFVTEDKNAHTFRVKIARAGEPVDLTGATVTGYFMRYKDRVSIPLTGTVEGSEAVFTLNEGCYSTRTMFCVTICVSVGGAKHAVFAGEGQMVLNRSDAIVDSENVIPSIEDIISRYDMMVDGINAATTAASSANTAAGNASAATSAANTAAANANNATERANAAAAALETAPVPTGTVVTYQAGTNATTPPTGTWMATPPTVPQGQYLWTRSVQSFTNGDPVTSYSVARQGVDGSGSVSSVNGVAPDSAGNVQIDVGGTVQSVNGVSPDEETGNITLTASDVGAVVSVDGVVADATGNVAIGAVRYGAAQALTDEQKAQVLSNLGLDGENSGGVEMEVLWENATPTSEFAPHTITLTKPTTDFDVILYIMRYQNTQDMFFSIMAPGENCSCIATVTSWTIRRRDITVGDSAYELKISGARDITSYGDVPTTYNNSLNVPYIIYGLKRKG